MASMTSTNVSDSRPGSKKAKKAQGSQVTTGNRSFAQTANSNLWVAGSVGATGSYRERLQAVGQETIHNSFVNGMGGAPPVPKHGFKPGFRSGGGSHAPRTANSKVTPGSVPHAPLAPSVMVPPVPTTTSLGRRGSPSSSESSGRSPARRPPEPSAGPEARRYSWGSSGSRSTPSRLRISTADLLEILLPDGGDMPAEEVVALLLAAAPAVYED